MECQECIQRETKERYITDMENPKLLLHSRLHCFMSLPSNPTIHLSFLPLFPPASPPLSPLVGQWHAGYSACACAVVYKQDVTAIRRNPICSGLCSQRQTTRGDGKNLMGQVDTQTHTHRHTYIYTYCTWTNMHYKPGQTVLCTHPKSGFFISNGQILVGITKQRLSHRALCRYLI